MTVTQLVVGALVFSNAAIGQYRSDEVIVKLRGKSSSLSAHAFIGKALSQKGMSLKRSFGRFNIHHFATKPGQDVKVAIDELMKDPSVEYAEPNYILKRLNVDEELMNTRYLRADLPSLGVASGDNASTLKLSDAQAHLSPSSDSDYVPVIAVIDTGVDVNHEIFVESEAIWQNPDEIPGNGRDDDRNGYVDDVNGWNFYGNNNDPSDDDGHGTHVAGISLSVGLDIFADQVQKARVKIMPLKFLGPNGNGTTSDAIAAIHYAVENGADVLNNSWGGPEYSKALHDAVAYSYNHGLAFVAAAGNSGDNNDVRDMYPAGISAPHVMAIAATDRWDDLASFSNYGQHAVDIGSPGVAILSTFPGNSYVYSSGTSMAAPFVAGLAALMKMENPDLHGYHIRQLIFEAGFDVGLATKLSTGDRIDIASGIVMAQSSTSQTEAPSYNASNDRPVRSVASEESSSDSSGCGMALVLSQFRGNGTGGGANRPPYFGLLVLMVLVPLVVFRWYSSRSPASRRRHQRYHLNTAVTMSVGGRELIGQIGTISLGGASLNTDAMLENGGVVKLQIQSPDGEGQIEVEGQIVWSDANSGYGVQFAETEEAVKSTIQSWTDGLVKSG